MGIFEDLKKIFCLTKWIKKIIFTENFRKF